ncbi:DUF2630 family protein [Rhodococcus triatomae]|uniref:DUF2630 family protein n=1 Tax=Rhodococcus triatomae TaxID=300028 RepID=A0A1G8A0W0_9NOCA|nr:DUF2630 family protein [Rhodococcus triatomae]QNG17890.1 DUF2630 family protein [Rhodococcus triatomae]QNG22442.1 DUF2630 family protein [Rhodococcus triatomae]SDH14574.1 Protein of unknown function [Rhodococcus triatomae]
MNHQEILDHIQALVGEEHELRSDVQSGKLSPDEEKARLKQVEEALDQCWDLLRQRNARKNAGQDPDDAQVRPASEVEGYLQ